MTGSVLAPVRGTFRAVAETVVPEMRSLGATDWKVIEGVVEQALAARPAAMRRQFVAFLRLVEWLPLVSNLRPFSRLGADARAAALLRLQDSPLLALRRGTWGVRTLVFMAYYSRDDVQQALGYRPHRDGWQARRAAGASSAPGAQDSSHA